MIRKGEAWGEPVSAEPDLVVTGDDAALALALASGPEGVLVAFRPPVPTDFSRALGLGPGAPGTSAVPVDLLWFDDGRVAVNAVVVGTPPDRLAIWHRAVHAVVSTDGVEHAGPVHGIVIANGQFVHGSDLVPRGHPGDGVAEVQTYLIPRRQRREMRRRLDRAAHLPHPGIHQWRARRIVVTGASALPLSIDGRATGNTDHLAVEVRPAPARLLV